MQKKIIIFSFLFFVSMFISVVYIPSLIQLSALENERRILLAVVDNQNKLERLLTQENTILKNKLSATLLELELQKNALLELQRSTVKKTPQLLELKKSSGNRGYIFKKH